MQRWSTKCFLMLSAVALVTSGCGHPPAESNHQSPTASEAAVPVQDAVAGIIEKAQSLTEVHQVELPGLNEEVVWRTPLRRVLPHVQPPDLRAGFPPPPQGIVVAQFTAPPKSMTIANSGVIVTGHDDGARAWPVAAGSSSRLITSDPVVQTQIDESGERLLLQTVTEVIIRTGEFFAEAQPVTGNFPPGRAHWYADGKLLFSNERIMDFNASAIQRIYTTAMVYDPETSHWSRPAFDPSHYASIGSIPVRNAAWGVPVMPYQINPLPGPVIQLDAEGTTRTLTTSVESADVSPSSDLQGDLAVVRTWRHGGMQARALLHWADQVSTPTLQLTDRATRSVSLAPSGSWAAVVVEPHPGLYELRRYRREEIVSGYGLALELYRQERILQERVKALADDLDAEWNRLHQRRQLSDGPPPGPSKDAAGQMGQALRAGLEHQLGVTLPGPPLEALVMMDAILDQIGDYLPERPGIIVGIGALVAEAIPEKVWLIRAEDVGLSQDVTDIVFSDGVSFVAVQPFALARDRLSGSSRLATSIVSALDRAMPVFVVENRLPATLERLQSEQLQALGIDPLRIRLPELEQRLGDGGGAQRTLHLLVYTMAEQRGNKALARRALMPLVESDPTNPRLVGMMARLLYDEFEPEAAARLYSLAVELDPRDPALRFGFADALLATQNFQGSREEFVRSGLLDTTGALTAYLPARLALVEKLRQEAAP